MREKLIKLIASGSIKCFEGECRNCEYDGSNPNCQNQLIADFLIKNGVVIADEVVSEELYKQVRWERDIAIKQLERIGVSLGEKTDNIVSVVRCGDCKYNSDYGSCSFHSSPFFRVSPNDYCNCGKIKESEE